jgi:peptidoglycan/LPS O-acetylase OafA/YrhL
LTPIATQPVAGNTVHTAPENRAYFPALDGVRAIAFLLVFAHHYARLEVGWVGVDIFFVLSGFLITGILFDTRDKPHRVRNFYVRRSLRIFPLYYGTILAIILATPFVHWHWDWRWLSWPLYAGNLILFVHRGFLDPGTMSLVNGWLTGAHGVALFVGHFWSLCVEEQFYLIWPWIVFKIKSRRLLIAIATTIVILGPLLRHLANLYLPADRIREGITAHGTPFRLDTLMMGALIALLYRGASRDALFKTAKVSIWIAGIVSFVVTAAVLLRPALFVHRGLKPLVFTLGFSLIAFFAGTLVVRCLISGTLLARILSNQVLRWIGRISYGAYIIHDMFHPFYDRMANALHVPVSVIALPATFCIAWLSFRFFESRFLDMKDRWTAA